MSWGTELWDQFDNVSAHTLRGIEFCEKYAGFVKDRSKVERDYAASLRKLVKSYTPKKIKDDEVFTLLVSFCDVLKEVGDIAGQHELLAETLGNDIIRGMLQTVSETKQERKRHVEEAKKLDNLLNTQIRTLDQYKKDYERAYANQVNAEQTHRAAEANMQLSRAEVEKMKNMSVTKSQIFSERKQSYAQILEKTNQHKEEHFNKHLPQVLQNLQEMDERRVCAIQSSLKSFAEAEKKIQPIINTCLEGIQEASRKVDHEEDSRRVVEIYKSGFIPPEDFEFLDLENGDQRSVLGDSSRKTSRSKSAFSTEKKKTGKKSSLTRGRADEEKEDFSHLNPQQQKKQLSKKIKDLREKVNHEIKERQALVKMQDVYTKNRKLGDPNALIKQLQDNQTKISHLEAELMKYERYLSAAGSRGGTPIMNRRDSGKSNISNVSSQGNATSTPIRYSSQPRLEMTVGGNEVDTSLLRQATRNNSHNSIPHADSVESADEWDSEPSQAIGKAVALFEFEATIEGSVSIKDRENLSILEHDTGDGWTRIRKDNGEEGFIPTSYIKVL